MLTPKKDSAPAVTVCVLAYNHEKFIRQCLTSILQQEANFEFEVVVGEDASTDGTLAIVKEFAMQYPSQVFPIIHLNNVGGNNNLAAVYRAARGKYIAHIDGDDYALPGKLQRQYDILQGHVDCVMCTHDMLVVDKDSSVVAHSFLQHSQGVFTLHALFKRLPFFAHSSKMFINDLQFLKILSPLTIDIELHIEQAKVGNIYHISDVLGGYRKSTGVSQGAGYVNPLIPAATRRVYANALSDSAIKNPEKSDITKYYARAVLNYAFQSALLGRRLDCRLFSAESIQIKVFSPLQFLLYAASFIPFGLSALARTRTRFQRRAARSKG